MIDYVNNEIRLRGKAEKITGFQVWWDVEGKGLYSEISEALKVGGSMRPVPVAVSETLFEVAVHDLTGET